MSDSLNSDTEPRLYTAEEIKQMPTYVDPYKHQRKYKRMKLETDPEYKRKKLDADIARRKKKYHEDPEYREKICRQKRENRAKKKSLENKNTCVQSIKNYIGVGDIAPTNNDKQDIEESSGATDAISESQSSE